MKYEKRMEMLSWSDPGAFVLVRADFLKAFGFGPAAVVLSELIFLYRKRLRKQDDGWAQFTTRSVQSRIPISRVTFERALKTLEKARVISISLRGFPKRRWLRINPTRIEKTLADASHRGIQMHHIEAPVCINEIHLHSNTSAQKGTDSQEKRGIVISLMNHLDEEDSGARSRSPASGSKNEEDEVSEYKKMAELLATAVRSVRRLSSSTSKWWDQFRILHRRGKVPMKTIWKVLRDYCHFIREEGDQTTNGNQHRIHIAHSSSAFRAKFDALEKDMIRWKGEDDTATARERSEGPKKKKKAAGKTISAQKARKLLGI